MTRLGLFVALWLGLLGSAAASGLHQRDLDALYQTLAQTSYENRLRREIRRVDGLPFSGSPEERETLARAGARLKSLGVPTLRQIPVTTLASSDVSPTRAHPAASLVGFQAEDPIAPRPNERKDRAFFAGAMPDTWVPIRVGGPGVLNTVASEWVEAPSSIVIGELPGTNPELSDQPVLLIAYADSGGFIPYQARGMQAAAGLAALLVLAEEFARNPQQRPIHFAVVPAHHFALSGERALAAALIGKSPYHAIITLDLSTGSDTVAALSQGDFYAYRNEARDHCRRGAQQWHVQSTRLSESLGVKDRPLFYDGVNESNGRPWRSLNPYPMALGCEPFVLAGMTAFTFVTVDDARSTFGTPADKDLNLKNLDRQLRMIRGLLALTLNNLTREAFTGHPPFPVERRMGTRQSLVTGFSRLEGQTVRYDPTKSFIPSTPVPGAYVVVPNRHRWLGAVWGDLVVRSDEAGRYAIEGLASASAFFINERRPTTVFALAGHGGNVSFASTFGTAGGGRYETRFMLATPVRSTPLLMAPLAPIVVKGIADPARLTPFSELALIDPKSKAPPTHGFVWMPAQVRADGDAATATVFAEPGKPVWIAAFGEGGGLRGLAEATPSAEGTVVVDLAKTSPAEFAARNEKFWKQFSPYGIVSPSVRQMMELAPPLVPEDDANWAARLRPYPVLTSMAADVLNGVLFFLFLLAPFAVFVERLTVCRKSLAGRIGATLAIFVGGFLALRAVHPAFQIVDEPLIIFVAFAMIALSVMVGAFVLSKFDEHLREGAAKGLKGHRGLIAVAASLALGSMHRRPLRTWLTASIFVGLCFMALSLTSIVPEFKVQAQPAGYASSGAGIYFRTPGYDPIPESAAERLRDVLSTAQPIEWAYAGDPKTRGQFWIEGAEGRIPVRALVGGAPNGTIRLAPKAMEALGAREGDRVRLAGTEFALGPPVESQPALDGSNGLPVDFPLSVGLRQDGGAAGRSFRKFAHLEPEVVAFVDESAVRLMGGTVRAFSAPYASDVALQRAMLLLDVNVYAAERAGAPVQQFSSAVGQRAEGFGLVAFMMALGVLFGMNTLLAGVHERTREIGILSALGMAPKSIAWVFVAESAIYGVIGAVGGYLLAQAVAWGLRVSGTLGSLTFNASASTAVAAVLIVMLAALASAIYPALLAAKLAAPASESGTAYREEDEHRLVAELPLSLQTDELDAAFGCLEDWLHACESAALSNLVAEDVSRAGNVLEANVWLAPFDMGLSQRLALRPIPSGVPDVWFLELEMERLTGDEAAWKRMSGGMQAEIRAQLLVWRTQGSPSKAAG